MDDKMWQPHDPPLSMLEQLWVQPSSPPLALSCWAVDGPDSWEEPVNLEPTANHPGWDVAPGISADGLALFFQSDRPGGYGGQDIWMTTRTTTNDDWSAPVNLGPTLNTSSSEFTPSISADGLTLYFGARDSDRSGGYGG